jgi:transposase-like protein
MEKRVQKPKGRKWHKYSPEFKQSAVDRLVSGESATVVARELQIRRKFLYAWRNAGYGSTAAGKPRRESVVEDDPLLTKIAKLEQELADTQRLVGQQAGELNFFVLALRAVKESRPKKKASSGIGFIPQSKM